MGTLKVGSELLENCKLSALEAAKSQLVTALYNKRSIAVIDKRVI